MNKVIPITKVISIEDKRKTLFEVRLRANTVNSGIKTDWFSFNDLVKCLGDKDLAQVYLADFERAFMLQSGSRNNVPIFKLILDPQKRIEKIEVKLKQLSSQSLFLTELSALIKEYGNNGKI